MDKNAIKKYAVWARKELIARVTQKAEQYEITEKKTTPADADSIGGRVLTAAEKKQRQALIAKINQDGFEQVMEEVAYTWFNRFIALRFMEVNNYLPSHTRVFTNENGEFKPQILADAIQLDLEGLNMDKVFALKDANKTEELYKYLLITQCNALSGILPRMFQKIEDYTELLLPDYLLREGSVIEQMIALIPEEDWTDQVQIIGWLYQYYNSEPKDAVFAALKKNVKISKENIPAATQLFTPDWIVRYMVENSLGRLWLEGHPNDALKSEWKYYLDEAEQEVDVQKQLEKIRKEYAALRPEEIRCIDPCMGSGHILCYMFDVLVKIYEDYGYTAREAVENIIKKNLWGLDIDERAAQLSYFAVMMKARQYDRRFFNKKDENGEQYIPQPHMYAIEESNGITSAHMHDMGIGLSQEEYGKAVKEVMRLVEEMYDAKEYGSIIDVSKYDWDLLRRFAIPRGISEGQLRLDIHGELEASIKLQKIINVAEAVSQKYHVVITNPPYMGSRGMDAKLTAYVKKKFPNARSDMFAVFIEKCRIFVAKDCYYGMITQPSFLFLTAFENLRKGIIDSQVISSLLHMGRGIFGIDFGSTAFVLRNTTLSSYRGVYMKLHQRTFQYIDPDDIKNLFLHTKINHDYEFDFAAYSAGVEESQKEESESVEIISNSQKLYYEIEQASFLRIPGTPIAYWLSAAFLKVFDADRLGNNAEVITGMTTGKNSEFLRFWYEVDYKKIAFNCSSMDQIDFAKKKWIPYSKGGNRRNWSGNADYVVNWTRKDEFNRSKTTLQHLYLRKALTWPFISSGKFSARFLPEGFLWDVAGSPCFFDSDDDMYYTLGFLCAKIADMALKIMNPTINVQAIDLAKLPYIVSEGKKEEIVRLVKENIALSDDDWNSFEVSWDFKKHPLVTNKSSKISEAFEKWNNVTEERFDRIKKNEERLNELFIQIYGLEGEINPSITDDEVTVSKADLQRDIRSLISYAIGCMFGRYSLDYDGLTYAGGEWKLPQYKTFKPDMDAIIPVCDDEYFKDDILGRFEQFVKVVYGENDLEENLKFIASALGGKGSSREVIRSYFVNDFYADHVKLYQKKPIYWLFDSGKKNGFKCLVYMHRYQPDTIARIRTDYVHEQQSRYRTAIVELEQRITGTSTSDRVKLNKQLIKLQAQAEEVRIYEEKIHHLADQMISIDLDDGVKHNYAIFKDVLAKIK